MLKRRGLHVFTFSVATILLASLFFSFLFVVALDSSQVSIGNFGSIESGPPTEGLAKASYYVVAYNSLFYAINGSNQQYFLVDGNAAYVINKVFGYMHSGQSVTFNGTFQIGAELMPTSNTYLNCTLGIFNAVAGKNMFKFSGQTNVTINGATANGEGIAPDFVTTYNAKNITVANCTLTGFANGIAINTNNGSGDVIENNTIVDNPGSWAIVANSPANETITSNYIDSWGNGSGIGVFGSTPYNPAFANNVISYNTVYNWTQSTWHGIYTGGCPNTRVYGNILSSNQSTAGVSFCLKGTNPMLVYDNTVYGSTGHAFMIYKDAPGDSPNGTSIYNNVLYGSGKNNQYAFYLISYSTGLEHIGNLLIQNNTISGFAIALFIAGADSNNYYSNVTFTGNTVTNCRVGFSVGYSQTQNSYTTDNVISNNIFINITGGVNPDALGYVATNVTGTRIVGNTASGTVTTPILLDKGIGTYISGNVPNNWGAP